MQKKEKPDKLHAKLTTSLDKYDFTGKLLIFDNVQISPMAVVNLTAYAKANDGARVCMLATVNGALRGEKECGDDLFVYELMPMTFDEFLKAGKGRKLWKYIENQRLTGMPGRSSGQHRHDAGGIFYYRRHAGSGQCVLQNRKF